jgi:hypothetical protein
MADKYLTDEERKCSNFVFAVLDATIAQYGSAILDCGHDTDGKRVGGYKDEQGRYYLVCFPCFDKYVKDNNIKLEVEDVQRTTSLNPNCKEGKC